MLPTSARQFHSLLVLPALVFLFFLAEAKTVNNHPFAAVRNPANSYHSTSPSMTDSHVWVDTVWCYDEQTQQSIATSAYLDGGEGSHPAFFPLNYGGTNVTLSFTGPVYRAGASLNGQAYKQILVQTNTGDSITVTLEPWEISGNPQAPRASVDFNGPGITSITFTSLDPDALFFFDIVGFDPCPPPPPPPTPSPTPTPVPTPDHAKNLGECCPNQMVGEPVNVTNGNVYLKQTDYSLPGVGEAIRFVRSYNSKGSRFGLFGPGWSTDYDEGLRVDIEKMTLRLFMPDGQATDFVGDANGLFTPLQPDFFGTINQNADGSFNLSFKDGRVHVFDQFGALLSLFDRNNNQTTLAYDQSGRLASVTDPSGRVVSVNTNVWGMVLSLSDSLGAIATYAYNSNFKLISVTYPDTSAFRFYYDDNGLMTSVTDVTGTELEAHYYDSEGRALISTKADSIERYSLNYVSDSETDVTDALGHVTKYFFDTGGSRNVVTRIEGLCNCGSGSQSQIWTYDNNLNVTSFTNGLNQVTTYTYDAQGNQLTVTDAAGTTTSTYNQFGELLSVTDALGGTTSITYDDQGLPVSITDPLNHTTSYASNSRGQLISVTDARGKATSFAYDSGGNLISRTDALGHATQFAYDARGRLTTTTNALGHVTAFAYDAVGRLTQITQADGSVIGYQYDAAGRPMMVTDAKGNRTFYSYDRGYRLSSEMDANTQTTFYQYDSMSNLVACTDALGRTTNFDYDDFNRPVKTTYPEAMPGAARLFATVTYDAAGNVTQRTDTAGRVTSYLYDDVNRLVSATDADNKTTTFEYDALGRTTALVDARSQRYRFNYDALGRLKHIRRGTAVMTFTYDAVGNRKHRTDYNGALTDYDYDALNRLKTITYPDTATVGFTYDKLSRLQTAANENGTVNFDYNKMNRLTRATDVFGQIVEYNYDDNGNRTRLSLNSAIVATYRYDALNRPTKILDAASAAFTFDYDAADRLTQKKAPNGVKTTYQYDGLDRLTRLLDAKGTTTIADRQYQYNTASQITQIAEPANTKSYGYDAVDRLTSALYTNPLQPAENYAYDAVGNRTSSQLSASYAYQPFNLLATTSTTGYTYDANGNLVSKADSIGTTQYSWDFENRLKQVTLPNGNMVTYKYDALGRRIQRTPSTGVGTAFIYDGREVIKDLNSDGSTVDYVNGPGIDNKLRLTDSRQSGPLYFLQDHLGSTTAFTNSSGASVSQMAYDSFGNPTAGASLTRYAYTGREFDSDTGLYYYRARWYDPKVGRFISEDPIGLAGGINQFAYVGNDPQNATDPSGLYEIDVHYYLTYYLAIHSGCFNDSEAREIANGDQHVDEDPKTMPGFGGKTVITDPRPNFAQQQANIDYHALHEGSHQPYLDMHWNRATAGRGSLAGLGIFFHYLQDTYSHRGFTDPLYGHSPAHGGSHADDKTDEDPDKAMEMAHATFDYLKKYARDKKGMCDCHDDVNWHVVRKFVDAPGGNAITRRAYDIEHVNPWYLNNKIQILGVPRR
jgi:RHS repeat-associated protein